MTRLMVTLAWAVLTAGCTASPVHYNTQTRDPGPGPVPGGGPVVFSTYHDHAGDYYRAEQAPLEQIGLDAVREPYMRIAGTESLQPPNEDWEAEQLAYAEHMGDRIARQLLASRQDTLVILLNGFNNTYVQFVANYEASRRVINETG